MRSRPPVAALLALVMSACSASEPPPPAPAPVPNNPSHPDGAATADAGGTGQPGPMTGLPDAGQTVDASAGSVDGVDGQGGSPYATEDCPASKPAGWLLCDTLAPLPANIAATGLFPAAPDFTVRSPALRAYAPSPELWSDGLGKQRYLLLPRGARIDNSKPAAWVFPVGTAMVKTFFDDGPGGGAGPAGKRPVETRIIRRTSDPFFEYEFAVYRWNADGKDATLLDIQGDRRTPVMVTLTAANGGKPFVHDIPSRLDCGKCHEPNAAVASTFVGFDELRLNGKLPGSARTQLEDLAAAGLFQAALPATPARIVEPDPVLAEVKTFVMGNCAHCHNGNQGIVDFRPDVFVANAVGKAADSPGTTAPAGWKRVIPGDPARSVLYVQASRAVPQGLNAMPPVGVTVPEPKSLASIKAWICALPGAPRPALAVCRP